MGHQIPEFANKGMNSQADPETLVSAVLASTRYRAIAPGLVRAIAAGELRRQPDRRAAIKAVRRKLHQVTGSYLDRPIDYGRAQAELRACHEAGDAAGLRRRCAALLACHASTRERLPVLATFYEAIFARVGPVGRLLDLGCGLNPLAIPWMALPAGCAYLAYDVHSELVQFLNAVFPDLPVDGRAVVADLLHEEIGEPADLALILKCVPCFEQVDRAATARLLARVNARQMVVSFPVRSLGGHARGMPAHYEDHFRQLMADRPCRIERLEFSTELAFLVTLAPSMPS